MYALNQRVWLYRPGTPTRAEDGQQLPPSYTKLYAHARLMSAGGQVSETEGLVVPDDRRRYIIRWIGDMSTKWFLQDMDGNWFAVESFAAPPNSRRRGHLLVVVSSQTDPNLTLVT